MVDEFQIAAFEERGYQRIATVVRSLGEGYEEDAKRAKPRTSPN